MRRRRRPIAATLTLTVVAGLTVVFALPEYGFAAAAPMPASVATAAVAADQDVSLTVAPVPTAAGPGDSRGSFSSLSVQDQREEQATSYRAAYASLPHYIGDDYPFKDLGYGTSPLSYALRNCTDFVAWRLNRDAKSTGDPWLMPWSHLTPNGGNAVQWKSAWLAHGWITSKRPVVGSVAWFGGLDHVAYVSKVNDDGTVLLEEYNNDVRYRYDKRTVSASDVDLFLYPPPLPSN